MCPGQGRSHGVQWVPMHPPESAGPPEDLLLAYVKCPGMSGKEIFCHFNSLLVTLDRLQFTTTLQVEVDFELVAIDMAAT